jgi:flagellar assembly factor FliW
LNRPAGTEFDFPEGLPAFEAETRFRLDEPPSLRPLVVLASLLTPGLRFVCLPVEWLDPAYHLELGMAENSLLCSGPSDPCLRLLAIVTFSCEGPPTANLRAPIVLNPAAGRGLQFIRPDEHYCFFQPLRVPPAGGSPLCS